MFRNTRGRNLDQKLEKLLAEMLTQGFEKAPISRASVQELLRLKSRSTLVGKRGEKIDAAREAQLKASGSYDDGKRRRLLLEEKNEILKKKVEELQDARNFYVEQLLAIVQQLQSKGINIEESLVVLRPNRQ